MTKEKILVIQTAFLGDALLTLPMIQNIKENEPECSIDVVCIPDTQEVFQFSDSVDNVIVFDKKGTGKSFFKLIKFALSLKKNDYTKIYSPHRSFRTSLLILMLGVNQSIGFDTAAMNFVYTKRIKYKKEIHEVARNLSLNGYTISDNNWKILPQISIPNEVIKKTDEIISRFNGRIIGIAPGSIWETKKYPSEYIEKVVKYFAEKEYSVLFIGGQKDFQICNQIHQKFSDKTINLAGQLSVIESLAIINRLSLLICNDSAPTHMGVAVDIPVLTIYCSTVPQFGFYPYNERSKSISFDDLSCKPCGIHGLIKCPINTFDCGYKLSPEKIIKTAEQLLNS